MADVQHVNFIPAYGEKDSVLVLTPSVENLSNLRVKNLLSGASGQRSGNVSNEKITSRNR